MVRCPIAIHFVYSRGLCLFLPIGKVCPSVPLSYHAQQCMMIIASYYSLDGARYQLVATNIAGKINFRLPTGIFWS